MTALAITMLVAAGLGLVASRLALPPLVGFLAAGFLLHGAGLQAPPGLGIVADLGIVLLLFGIGLKLDPRTLARRDVWATTVVHLVVSVLLVTGVLAAIGWLGVDLLDGVDVSALALVGLAIAFSSTVLVVKILEQRSQLPSLFGRTAIGILIVQDLAAVVFITATKGSPPSWWALSLILLAPLTWLLHRALDRVRHDELLIVVGIAAALAPGYLLFDAVGLKGDLGALVMGVLLGRHPRASELGKGLWSIKELLLVGFFLSIGFDSEGALAPGQVLVALALLALAPLQGIGFAILLRWQGLRTRTSALTGLSLANHSEFGLIVVAAGVELGILSGAWLSVMAIAVAASFALSAALSTQAGRITRWTTARFPDRDVTRLRPEDRPIDIGDADALVLGLGRVGRAAYQRLVDRHGMQPMGIELDPERVDTLRKAGLNAVEADATDPDFWERCQHHPGLRLVVLAMPSHGSNLAALRRLRGQGFTQTVAAISRDDDDRDQIVQRGADTAFQVYDGAGASLADRAAEAAILTDPRDQGPDGLEDPGTTR